MRKQKINLSVANDMRSASPVVSPLVRLWLLQILVQLEFLQEFLRRNGIMFESLAREVGKEQWVTMLPVSSICRQPALSYASNMSEQKRTVTAPRCREPCMLEPMLASLRNLKSGDFEAAACWHMLGPLYLQPGIHSAKSATSQMPWVCGTGIAA